MSRSRALILLAAVLPLALLAVAPTSAQATPVQGGVVLIHGPGSVYAGPDALTSIAVSPGTTAQYAFEVVNRGTEAGQFLVKLITGLSPATVTVSSGTLNLSPVVLGPNGYYTNLLAPGKLQTFSLKVAVPANAAQGESYVEVDLYDTGGNPLSFGRTWTEIVGPAHGVSPGDIYAHNGGQKPVGGDNLQHIATAPSISTTGSATFTVRLQNDGFAPGRIGMTLVRTGCAPANFPVTVKAGASDVSAAVASGTYQTGVLAVGAHQDVSVVVKHTGVRACGFDAMEVQSQQGAGGPFLQGSLFLVTNLAA
jgi:hypothetical protein